MAELDAGNCETSTSYFSQLYKFSNRDISFSLEKKRKEFLQTQKDKRKEAFNEKRDLSDLFIENEVESMEVEPHFKRTSKKKAPFWYKIMEAEWFIELPDDLDENWLVKFCPKGVRFLVVAHKALTTCYYKNGRVAFKFKSKLPGGCIETASKFTVLDCVFSKKLSVLFVFDALAWNSLSLLDAEASLRFFWLKSKFDENPEILRINSNFNFVLLKSFPPEISLLQENLSNVLSIKCEEVIYDGVLFYHKDGHYVSCRSPLVGWLKPFMLREIFNIDVPEIYMNMRPHNYESIHQYIQSKNKKRRDFVDTEMLDVEEVNQIDCDL